MKHWILPLMIEYLPAGACPSEEALAPLDDFFIQSIH
jgi:hypothetical protein